MFGIIPKTLWSRSCPADDRNRITLGLNCALIRSDEHLILVDSGFGRKLSPKLADIYGLDGSLPLEVALGDFGIAPEEVTLVIPTHLHIDHAGGLTRRDLEGNIVPTYPNARHVLQRAEWELATHPNEITRGTYLPDNFEPLREAGLLDLVDGDAEIVPGVRVELTGGHTEGHQVVWVESEGETALFVAEMVPTTHHLRPAYIMAYDTHPLETLVQKKRLLAEAHERKALVIWSHDPAVPIGRLAQEDGRWAVAEP